jgi:tetratricopeptide (TPR) repeat protein
LKKGDALYGQGQYDDAISEYGQAIESDATLGAAYRKRAHAWQQQGQDRQAVDDYSQSLSLEPDCTVAYYNRAKSWWLLGDYPKAIADLEETLRLNPMSVALNDLAWLLATCPDEQYRDGKKAVSYATSCCEHWGWTNPAYLDTLAAAYAEAGDSEQAVKWQQKALDLAPLDQKEPLESRLKLYQQRKPYREVRKG